MAAISFYQDRLRGARGTTFIIDEKGIVVDKIDQVDTKQHTQQALSYKPLFYETVFDELKFLLLSFSFCFDILLPNS